MGREPLNKKKEEKRGFGLLQKWLTAKGSGGVDTNKVENKEDTVEGENMPGPRVKELKGRFEDSGGATGPKKGRENEVR